MSDPGARELKEALERETATAAILQIIASSPADTQPVFDAIVQSGLKLFPGALVSVALRYGDKINAAAVAAPDPARVEAWRRTINSRTPLARDYMHGAALLDRRIVDIPDVADAPAEFEAGAKNFLTSGNRAITIMPMMRGGEAIGLLSVVRLVPGPLSDEQLAVLRTFAAQAVIAIENTRLVNELRQRTDDLSESLEQQTATSEVLRVISSSPGELEPVFQSMLENAVKLCEARFGVVYRYEDGACYLAGVVNAPPAYEAFVKARGKFMPEAGNALDRALETKQLVHTIDQAAERVPTPSHKLAGARSQILVPMLNEQELVGAIAIFRQEVRPFSGKQIELVTNFAAQAVIAIENTRLLTELRQRTDDLSESLEQQTATSEVLRVISSSLGELEPVFQAMLKNATHLCAAKFGILYSYEAEKFRTVAMLEVPPAFAEWLQLEPRYWDPTTGLGRLVQTKQAVHIPDVQAERLYLEGHPQRVAFVQMTGVRTFVAVPLLKDNELIGSFCIFRQEVRPFTDKQIELVQNFAAQAVIAIENTRLLKELHQRTDDLTESLEQQTATAEVLSSISGSMTDTKPVFDAIVRNLLRLFGTRFAVVQLLDDGIVRMPAVDGEPGFERLIDRYPRPLDDMTAGGQAMLTKKVVQYSPVLGNPTAPPETQQFARDFGFDAVIFAPMLRGDTVIGAIGVSHHEPRVFNDKQAGLIKAFADQAVIAIENARLLNELRQRTDDLTELLEQQTTTADMLKVISRAAFDLQTVLETLIENATRSCGAEQGFIFLPDGGAYKLAVSYCATPEFVEHIAKIQIRPERGYLIGRVLLNRQPVHILDALAEPDYQQAESQRLGGYRTMLGVPMLRGGAPIGVIVIWRNEVSAFTPRQIELAMTFADQAAIALENVRQATQLEAQSQELRTLNQGLEQRVDEQVGEIERMGRLRRFLPPQVADLIVSSGSEKQLESHRREITALFCDLRGFTGFSETSDPEDVMALLREYHKAIGEIIFRHGGTLERFAGDGVMVIFNDPVPLPNPALSAVQMALEMRAGIGALIEKWRRLGHELGFGIGIAHGYATLGTIGFEGRFDYAAIGTVSNVASRLCDEAAPGQILVSPRVLLAVENAVSVEPVREMALKGIRRPMLVHNVVGAATGSSGGS